MTAIVTGTACQLLLPPARHTHRLALIAAFSQGGAVLLLLLRVVGCRCCACRSAACRAVRPSSQLQACAGQPQAGALKMLRTRVGV